MKRNAVFAVLFVLLAAAVLSGCGSSGGSDGAGGSNGAGGEPVDTLSGGVLEILEGVLRDADSALSDDDRMPQTFKDPVTADTAQGMLGLTPEQYGEYVTEAYVATGALMTSAHEVALIKCKDFDAAEAVKDLVAGGFDSAKWICVMPEESFVVDSGSYVLLAAVGTAAGDAIIESFTAAAGGNVGDANVFFEGQ